MRTSSNLPRGLAAIEMLVKHVDGLPLKAIAEELDISRSMAHRVLAELVECGYVQQEGELSPYRLTIKLASLGLAYLGHTGVTRLVQPILDELARSAGELVRLSLVEKKRLVWIGMAQGARGGLRYDASSDPGEEVCLFCSSNGHAWLSCLTDEKALEYVSRQGWGDPAQYGPNAPKNIQELLDCLKSARHKGYATIHDGYELGVSSMSAPFFHSDDQQPAGAVSIAGPSSRLTPEKLAELAPVLLAAAKKLSGCSKEIKAVPRSGKI
jgi:DNA-binding IclR family transcriptional regulator